MDELLKTFKTLETKEAYKIQRSALRKSAKLMESKIKQATPYDTGELKNSWFVKVLRFSRQKMNIIFTVSNTPETFYGKFVEFGAMNFWNKKAMNKHKGFVSKTVDRNGGEAFELFVDTFKKRMIAYMRKNLRQR